MIPSSTVVVTQAFSMVYLITESITATTNLVRGSSAPSATKSTSTQLLPASATITSSPKISVEDKKSNLRNDSV